MSQQMFNLGKKDTSSQKKSMLDTAIEKSVKSQLDEFETKITNILSASVSHLESKISELETKIENIDTNPTLPSELEELKQTVSLLSAIFSSQSFQLNDCVTSDKKKI